MQTTGNIKQEKKNKLKDKALKLYIQHLNAYKDIASTISVSPKTVKSWIKGSKEGN